ncbi:MAG: sulfatase-like hydrolase/transferase [Gemmatimonadaceae bacterium]
MTALVAGLIAAAVQVAIQLTNAVIRGRMVFASRDVVWMAPISWSAFILLVALPVAVVALATPRLKWRAWSVAFFGALVVLFLLVPYEGIATWAAVLVGTGVGLQLARMLPTDSSRWPAILRRCAGGLLAGFGVAGLAVSALGVTGERRVIAALPPADSTSPNVLLVVFDVVRAANLSAYGYDRPTSPILAKIAQEGVMFDRAYSVAPWTLPSHASMFTGRYPTELSTSYQRALEPDPPTLAEAFRDHGYRTAGFTANEVYTAWDSRLNRGFERWSDYQRTWNQIRLSGLPWQTHMVRELRGARTLREAAVAVRYFPLRAPTNLPFDVKHSDVVSRDFLEWQRSLPSDRPFFAFLNLFDAHRPRFAPPDVQRRFQGRKIQFDRYDSAIAFMDQQLGLILDSLRTRGQLDRTVVAIVGDHGELLGEHTFVGHSNTLYRDVLWVPFLLRYPPRIANGRHVTASVSLRDLGATLLDLSGVAAPPGFGGSSLAPLVGDSTLRAPSPVFSFAHHGVNVDAKFPNSRGVLFSIVLDSVHYIRHPGKELLFNLAADGAEEHNLLTDVNYAARVQLARRLVDSLSHQANRP